MDSNFKLLFDKALGSAGALGRRAARGAEILAEGAAELLYPSDIYCLCCGDSMENTRIHGICDVCASEIDWAIEDPFIHMKGMFAFDAVYPCCRYGFYPRQIMSGFKLAARPYAARNLGRLLAERLALEDIRYDFLTEVPVHKEKLRLRGFNQSQLMAEYCCRLLGAEHLKNVLIKTRPTSSMRLSTGNARRHMLEDSFAVAGNMAGRVKGADIVLVDDVVTTGSTADACAAVLKAAGASSVRVLCFACASAPQYLLEDEPQDSCPQEPNETE